MKGDGNLVCGFQLENLLVERTYFCTKIDYWCTKQMGGGGVLKAVYLPYAINVEQWSFWYAEKMRNAGMIIIQSLPMLVLIKSKVQPNTGQF